MSKFSSVKHLASVIREVQNLEVRDYFKDVLDSGQCKVLRWGRQFDGGLLEKTFPRKKLGNGAYW